MKAGEVKEVKVTLKVPTLAESDPECKIKIPCTAAGSDMGTGISNIETGITMPVHIKILTLEENPSENISSGNNSIVEKVSSSKSARNLKIKNIVQKFVENSSEVGLNFTQNIISLGETSKSSAENLKVNTIASLDNTIINVNNTIKNTSDTIKNSDNILRYFEYIQKMLGDQRDAS